ncbi:MAG: hypothetical protein AAFX53_08575 [Bacteroidota bacterium]
MENSNLKRRILKEMEKLISQSCLEKNKVGNFEKLHVALLKNHYNAADVSIDYHRRRIKMNIVMDDSCYDPKRINLNIPTLHANIFFRNLKEFLKSCLDRDIKNIGFYASLIQAFAKNEVTLNTA